MSKVTKINYELAKQALDELKRNPSNLQAYQLAELMAEKEAFNIKNWNAKLKEFDHLNERLKVADDYLEAQTDSEKLKLGLIKFNLLLARRDKIFPFVNEYKSCLELFTAYRAYAPPEEPKKIVTEQKSLELITS